MKFTKMLPPASDKNVKQPMLTSLMEVLELEKFMESLTRKVSTVQIHGGIGVGIGSPDGRVAVSVRKKSTLEYVRHLLRNDQNLPGIFLNMVNDSPLTRLCRRR